MRSTTKKRLAEVERAIGSRPVPTELVRAEFERFRQTGELPEDARVAAAVVRRVRWGYDTFYMANGRFDWGRTTQAALQAPKREADEVTEGLLNEAVNGPPMVRAAARQVLRGLAQAGRDVTTTLFVGRKLPEYGAVGAEMLGLPQRFAKAPFVKQAKRLFARIEDLRPRLPQRDRKWFQQRDDAISRFQLDGERPDDDLMLEVVLVLGELNALFNHAAGEDVREAMAAFDAISRSKGEGRDAAIGRLQEMAREGRFARPEG